MKKILRIVSTVMIAAGLVLMAVYCLFQNSNKLGIFETPSYYAVKNYWMMFVAGFAVLLFSELGSFFSWSKKMDEDPETLPNAGYATDEQIQTWVTGKTGEDRTEIMAPESGSETYRDNPAEKTEILPEEKTAIMDVISDALDESLDKEAGK